MLETLLKSKAEVAVLGVALFEDNLHLREIARRAGVSPAEAKRELDNLVSLGVLTATKRGNQTAFSRDEACPFLAELRGLYLKTEGVAGELKRALTEVAGIDYAFIYGSLASGKERSSSDVDLMVIGNAEERDVLDAVLAAQRTTSREINYILWSREDFSERAAEQGGFIQTLLERKRAWLRGEENGFVRTIKEERDRKNANRPGGRETAARKRKARSRRGESES